jgi:catechol 2,3-dioxygenase-like lactoylglutathione lyase family enzyme
MGVKSLHHVAIRVRDPDASRRFYEDVLGFGFMEIPVSGEFIADWEGAPAEGALLAMQAGDTFVILEPPLEGTGRDDRFSERRIGVDHLAFGVDDRQDLERLAASLGEAGVETAGVELDPVLGKEYVAFRDPDNVQWEFYMSV